MSTKAHWAAFRIVRAFRQKEMNTLEKHLRKFGPLPELPQSVLANVPADGPPPFVLPNPFLPKKHTQEKTWMGPRYSLRRQAELVKKARALGELHLLPDGPKTYAAELRAERVKKSLSPAVAAQLEEQERQASMLSKYATKAEEEKAASQKMATEHENRVKQLTSTLARLEKDLKKATAKFDEAELAAFDAEADETLKSDQVQNVVENVEQLEIIKMRLEDEVEEVETLLEEAQDKLNSIAPSAEVQSHPWKAPVHWVPEFKRSEGLAVELGTRLYSGKKRMFKGHLWERKRAARERKHAILMRDMPARIARYKNYYKKRKPNPLKPSRLTKPPKLPY